MQIVKTNQELNDALSAIKRPLGFVPTMGFLHDGHLSLVRQASEDNLSVAVSIFTNPTQFSPEEDLENYPTDLDRDLRLLSDQGVDLVWIPSVKIMYPEHFQTWVDVELVTKPLEGIFRSTHFRGVTTVVAMLFNAVHPERAYLGQKDAQQAVVIQQMVRDLHYPIEIVVCPIIREPDGLAMSSRNSYLNEKERQAAQCLSRGLFAAQDAFLKGEQCAENLCNLVRAEIEKEKLAEVQYISCAHPETLVALKGDIQSGLLSLAVFIGKTRLIDNLVLMMPNP